jgi:YD repeat-containing protein
MKRLILAGAAAACLISTFAQATETIVYTYDAKGRLVKVERTPASTINTNVKTDYTHDKADNRTNVKTAGSPN